jgi:hypothetical protein
LFSTIACAQYIPFYAKLTDGTGNVSKTAFLHFELQNCGSNFPIVPGNSQVVVQTAFDIKPNQSAWGEHHHCPGFLLCRQRFKR